MSLYLRDGHTPEALRRLRPRPQIWFTPFHKVEVTHGIAQKVFRRDLSLGVADRIQTQLERDCAGGLWLLADFPAVALETAAELGRKHVATLGTRTLDMIHVASAFELKAAQFWTFDGRQAKLAKAVGLKVS